MTFNVTAIPGNQGDLILLSILDCFTASIYKLVIPVYEVGVAVYIHITMRLKHISVTRLIWNPVFATRNTSYNADVYRVKSGKFGHTFANSVNPDQDFHYLLR